MRRSFEELIGSELDQLYRAALFLVGGRTEQAERLLTAVALSAHREYASLEDEPERPGRWLLERLASTALHAETQSNSMSSATGVAPSPTGDVAVDSSPETSSLPRQLHLDHVAAEASGLPLRTRIAFWFAVIERRRYSDIGEILDEPPSSVAHRIRVGHRVIVHGISRSRARRERGRPG